jgi:hypothetical protein
VEGEPQFGKYEQIYVKPGQEQKLTPRDIALLRLNKTLEQQYNEMRKKAKAVA